MVELKDTIEMMESKDYKERFKAEYFQLDTRIKKLEKMVSDWDKNAINFSPSCPREWYDEQLSAMRDYRRVLKLRAEKENVDVSDAD